MIFDLFFEDVLPRMIGVALAVLGTLLTFLGSMPLWGGVSGPPSMVYGVCAPIGVVGMCFGIGAAVMGAGIVARGWDCW